MSFAYASCLIALHNTPCGCWEISRLLDHHHKVTMKHLTELTGKWNRVPLSERHLARLSLRREHPEEFALAAERLVGPGHAAGTRLRCAMYLPRLWPQVEEHFALMNKYAAMDWGVKFAEADDDFLASLPKPVYHLLLPELAEEWWWRGGWTKARQIAAIRPGGKACLQFAMLSGDADHISKLLGAEEKRKGYGIVWEFLQGQSQSAYLALKKLVTRRKAGVPVFDNWVALWMRLIALSQGDEQLFHDPRLSGNAFLETAFWDVSLKNSPSGQGIELGCGFADIALWIARQHNLQVLRLPAHVRNYWSELEVPLLYDQLQEQPATPILPKVELELPWQTFLRLLDTQSELLGNPTPSGGNKTGKGGALLWHLFAPEIVFYNDKSATPDSAPEKLAGKHLNSKTLFSRMPNYLDDHDRLAMGKVRMTPYGSALLNAEVLRLLVNHPRVYIKQQKARLVERVQHLRIERDAIGLRLRLWPEIPPERDYLLEENGLFWTRSPLEKHLQPLLHEHAAVPVSAEKELRAAVSKWADRIEVEVGEGLRKLEQAQFQADQLVLRARAHARGMRFEWLVRCTEYPSFARPAFEGRERERLADDGSTVLVVRDFAWEERQLELYLAACPSLTSEPSFRVESLHEVLELLQECQAAGIALEWPEGAAWKVRRAQALSVAVRQAVDADWFTLEGGLQLDHADVLELGSALAAARLAHGSFLRLGENDFVRVSSELREQLEALADLADTEQPRIPALAVPSLAELELSGLSSDSAFQERLETFQECADFVAPVPRRLEAELRDYQLDGFRWLARHARMGTGACLADDMGLGKTLQAITLMLNLRSDGPHLVVCPLSVLAQWEQQIEQFAPTLRAGQNRELKGLKAGDVVLCSYGVLLRDIKKLSKIRWSVAVLDEAQAIKNPQSKTARCAYQLQARVRVATTGTPIENRLSELWSLFAFLNPGLLGTLAAFRRRYEQPGVGRSRLRRLIAPFVLRRLKSQVLSELPPRTEITLKVSLGEDELALYESLRAEAQLSPTTLSGRLGARLFGHQFEA